MSIEPPLSSHEVACLPRVNIPATRPGVERGDSSQKVARQPLPLVGQYSKTLQEVARLRILVGNKRKSDQTQFTTPTVLPVATRSATDATRVGGLALYREPISTGKPRLSDTTRDPLT